MPGSTCTRPGTGLSRGAAIASADGHPAVDHVDEHLQQRRSDPAATGCSGHQHRARHRGRRRAATSSSPSARRASRCPAAAHPRRASSSGGCRSPRATPPTTRPRLVVTAHALPSRVDDREARGVAASRLAAAARRTSRVASTAVVLVEHQRRARVPSRSSRSSPRAMHVDVAEAGRGWGLLSITSYAARSAVARSPCSPIAATIASAIAPGVERLRRPRRARAAARRGPARGGTAGTPPGRILPSPRVDPRARRRSASRGRSWPAPSSAAARTRRRARHGAERGRTTSVQGSRPHRWCSASTPAGRPGTATVGGPTAYGTSWPPKSIAICCGTTPRLTAQPGHGDEEVEAASSRRSRRRSRSRSLRRQSR